LEAQLPNGKKLLKLNMDETSCRLHYEAPIGVFASEPVALDARRGFVYQAVTRGQTRACLSHVALVCDDAEVQAQLPQYILGNERTLQASVISELVAEGGVSENLYISRRKSAWVDDASLAIIAAHWGRVLTQVAGDCQPVLLVDACPVHMGKRFLAACARWHIWVSFIPAKLTWLLQPCDTHCFAKYKRSLRDQYHKEALRNAGGAVSTKQIILHIDHAIKTVLQGTHWGRAFSANGFGATQRHVRKRILKHLQMDEAPRISRDLPTLEQFSALFPRNRVPPLAEALACHRRLRPPPVPEVGEGAEAEPVAAVDVWHGRLRSSSRLGLDIGEGVRLEPASSSSSGAQPPLPPPPCPPPNGEVLPPAVPPWARRPPVGRPLHPLRRRSREF
jgi:hypothetical protein